MVEKLLLNFLASSLILDKKLFHVSCIPHILNLIVKDRMQVLEGKIGKISESANYWTTTSKRIKTFVKAICQIHVNVDKALALDCLTR